MLAFAFAFALAAPAPPPPVATAEVVAQKQVAAYNAHDVEALAACFGDDVEFRSMEGKVEGEKGVAALRKGYAQLFKTYPKLKVKILDRIIQGTFIIDQQQAEGMGPDPIVVTAIYQISQGKIIRVWYIGG